jgi:hypothetical protein
LAPWRLFWEFLRPLGPLTIITIQALLFWNFGRGSNIRFDFGIPGFKDIKAHCTGSNIIYPMLKENKSDAISSACHFADYSKRTEISQMLKVQLLIVLFFLSMSLKAQVSPQKDKSAPVHELFFHGAALLPNITLGSSIYTNFYNIRIFIRI